MENNNVVINIDSLDTEVKTIPSASGSFNIKEQIGLINLGKQRLNMTLTLNEHDEAYPVGDYELDLVKSLTVGNYGKLELVRRPKLVPIS